MNNNYEENNIIEGEFNVVSETTLNETDKFSRKIRIDPKKVNIVYVFLALNIIVWIAMSLFGMIFRLSINHQLIIFGAKVNVLIAHGEVWRLVTAMFLHVNLLHLFFNSYALFLYGPYVEKLYGKVKFVIIYLLSGILGTIFSYMFNPNPAAGASGAIFGLLGSILFLRTNQKELFRMMFGPGLILIVVLNLMYGIFQPGIDNWGHIGGLVGGYALAFALGTYRDNSMTYQKVLVWIALGLIVAFSFWLGITKYV